MHHTIFSISHILGLITALVLSVKSEDPNSEKCFDVNDDEICYSIESAKQRSWFTSYQMCREKKGSTLPVVRNMDEQNALQIYLTSLKEAQRVTSAWTAGQNKRHEWTWLDGQKKDDDIQFVFGHFNATHAMLTYNYSFVQRFAPLPAQYICQFHGSDCHQNTVKLTNSCVVLSEYFEPWHDARRDCLSSGGDLAVLSREDIQLMKDYLEHHHPEEISAYLGFWIGLRKESWYWITDTRDNPEEVKYSKWSSQLYLPSDVQCIYAETSTGIWKASACSNEMASVVCEKRSATSIFLGSSEQRTKYIIACAVTAVVVIVILSSVIVVLLIKRRRALKACARHRVSYQTLQTNQES